MEFGAGKAVQVCGWLTLWKDAVEERIAKNAEATKIINHTLYVSTANSAWAQELTFLKPEIIKRFNQRAGKEVIKDIKFRAGGLDQ
jgi:predicted nucleic acid-binding Zn ribbon protein